MTFVLGAAAPLASSLPSSPKAATTAFPTPHQFPQIGGGGSPLQKNLDHFWPLMATLRQRADDLWRCGNGGYIIH